MIKLEPYRSEGDGCYLCPLCMDRTVQPAKATLAYEKAPICWVCTYEAKRGKLKEQLLFVAQYLPDRISYLKELAEEEVVIVGEEEKRDGEKDGLSCMYSFGLRGNH